MTPGLCGHETIGSRTDMQGEAHVGLGEAREQAVGQHGLGAAAAPSSAGWPTKMTVLLH